MALSSTSAAATSQQLYGPYGGLRYATGSMPTAKGYTGQYADAASSGLDYYNARYYDPLIGQFTSADSQADGLNRYAYVHGNPETATDPSGHCGGHNLRASCGGGDGGGGGGSGGKGGGGSGGKGGGGKGDGGDGGCGNNCPQIKHDKDGKCANQYTCDLDRAAAAKAAQHERDKDLAIATVLGIVLDILRMAIDRSDAAKEITDAINLMGSISNGLGLAATWLFGADSWETQAAQALAATANKVLGALRAVQAVENLWWAGALIMGALVGAQAAEGGLAPILGVVTALVGNAIIAGASSFVYVFAQRGQEAALEADKLGGETTYEYCTSTPGACGNVNWSA